MRHNSRCKVAKPKAKYKVRNWAEYNKALVNRGSLTLWIDKANDGTWYQFNDKKKEGVLIRIQTLQ